MPAADRLGRWRIAGFVATSLMAVSAYGAGALPGSDPEAGLLLAGPLAASWPYWLALATWVGGLVLLCLAWWRLGAAVLARRHPVTLGWLLGTGAIWAAPLLLAPPMGSRDVYSYACQGALWLDGVDPYRIGVGPGGCPWAEAVPSLWRETTTPYGPLAVLLAGAVVAVARVVAGGDPDGQLLVAVALLRAVALVGGSLIAWYVPRLARACGVDPIAAAWLALVSPLVGIHLVAGAHNDALMVGLLLAALTVVATRPEETGNSPASQRVARAAACLVAGGALGLAAAIKIIAILAFPFVVLLAVTRFPARITELSHVGWFPGRPGGRPRLTGQVWPGLGWVGAAMVVAFGGVSLVAGLDLGWVGALGDTGSLVQWTSLPTGLGMAVGYLLWLAGSPEAFEPAVAVARVIGLGALAAAAAALVGHAWWVVSGPAPTGEITRQRVVRACGAAFAALALLSPVFYPWYGLTAIAILGTAVAGRRVRRWLGVAIVALSFLVLPNGQGVAVLTKVPGSLLELALVIALLVAAARRRGPGRSASARQPRSTSGPDRPPEQPARPGGG